MGILPGNFNEEVTDSVTRSARWLIGGASGGLITYWVTNDFGQIQLISGAIALFIISVFVDLLVKTNVGELQGWGDR